MTSVPLPSLPSRAQFRPLATAAGTAGLGWLALKLWPALEINLFAGGTASLAGLLTGIPVQQIAEGWLLSRPGQPVSVTAACSATDYFLMLAALLAWHIARRGRPPLLTIPFALSGAVALSLFVNALRVISVAAAHRWFIPLLPDTWSAFLHMLTGAAVFLPSLILVNLGLESYVTNRPAPSAR